MARNYYVILGVASDATQDQIKSAYRRKAKQLHPDCYEGSSEGFRNVQEAYEVLSDRDRRATYDDELARLQRPQPTHRYVQTAPSRPTRCPVEPLIPDRPLTAFREAPSGRYYRSPFRRSFGHLWDDPSPTAWGLQGVLVDVPLTREQAICGGRIRVEVPTKTRCPTCWGRGRIGFYECWECQGEGFVSERRPVWIAFPPGIPNNTVAEVSLAQAGTPDLQLSVRFSVR